MDKRRPNDAIPGYVDGESVDGQQVVLWYMLHFTHQPRAEDWVDMPVASVGFELMPRDFLDGGPLQPSK